MKTFIITSLALFLSGTIFGQNIIEQHFQQYKGQDNFTNIHVTGKMFQLATYIDNEDNDPDLEELKQFASTIKEFKMIVGEEQTDAKSKFQTAVRKVSSSHEELMRVDDSDGSFAFYILESKGIVSELAMVGMGTNEFVAFSLTGNMDLRQISKMSKKIGGNGFEHVGKLFDNGVHDLKVYPNPAKVNSSITVEVPKEMNSGNVTLIDMNGKRVKTNELNGNKLDIKTSGLPAGTYILEIKNDKASIRKKVVLQ